MTQHRRPADLDPIDLLLLEALQRDGRTSLTDLAAGCRLSVSATRARLRVLFEREVVRGTRAQVDPQVLGYALRAVVRVKVHGALYDQILQVIAREPQIVRCVRVTGETCYIAEVLATDMADLERITTELAKVGSIVTDLVYEVVCDRPVPTSSAPA